MGSFIAKTKTALFAVATTLTALSAQAFQITSFSPQGEVSPIRQIVVKFDEPAVNLGEPKGGSAPLKVECTPSEGRVGSSSRWVSDKVLALDFENDLPPNVTCTAQVVAGFKSAKGIELTGTRSYKFHTGGAVVIEATPYAYRADNISEDQFFSLRFNGTVDAAKVQANVWCAVEGLGEKVSIRLIEGKERAVWLKAQRREMSEAAAKNPASLVLFACNRALTPASKVQVVYGKGIYFSDTVEKRSTYTVREPFNLRWSCERENAQSACLPIRPLTLTFTAPVSKEVLEAIRLQSDSKSGSTTWKPKVIHESGITFASPFPEKATLTLEFPPNFKDDAGRTLHNAPQLQITTDAMPPLAKFSAAPFGVVERFAEPNGVAVLPITLRNVESFAANLPVGKVKTLRPTTDADIIRWFLKVRQYEQSTLINKVETRAVSLLDGEKDGKGSTLKTQDLPKPVSGDPRPFEVVGIPLSAGFHVVEIASKKLGQHLLDPNQHGKDRTMYVRTSALVTNLGVHFKLGRENSLAWVTTLDKGKPVANALVRVSDCKGKEVAIGKTNAQGIAQFTGISPQAPTCNSEDRYVQAYFVSARASQPAGEGKVNESLEDLAFTWSDWNKGIESWRFNFPTSQDAAPDEIAHTILDRSLFRAGQTVSMKHLLRTQISKGFGLPEAKPTSLTITHIGSGQQYTQPLTWRKTPTGGLSAVNTFAIPPAAKLGVYQVELRAEGNNRSFTTTSFRVEEFRLPVFEGRITPSDKKPLVGISTLPIDVQVNFVSGGGAANLPVRVSALVREKYVNYADFADFNFSPPRSNNNNNNNGDGNGDEETIEASTDEKVIANKLPVTLDKNGAGKLKIDKIPSSQKAQELVMEATYSDPNGEVQTLRSTQTLWPAGVVVGIKTEGWVSSGGKIQFQAVALDVHGKPKAGVALDVKAYARITTTSRKRMVGGFYTYDNQTANKELGSLCSGQSDARGLLLCEASMTEAGEIELVATAQDGAGHSVQAASTVYVTQQGEMWFGGDNHDRIDLLPEKKNYEIGETAKFQVRMPFRFATALVTVEREGILESQIVQLNGKDPTISLKIKDEWGPNVYVSALVLRGRLREVPWYSFFTWGYKAPREWWTGFWYEGKEYVAPTAMVDLSKPAYRLGVAEIRIGTQAHQLTVNVKADKESYSVRGKANVLIQVKLPNGQPAANAEVALAAVDQALLELMPNESWKVLEAMLQNRSWGVETSTAQMEIIGRRHYGRKAVPAGGSGGKGGTRELLDTLLLWNPSIQLDANGQATVMVPLNDALTTFQIVVIADSATGFFGTGKTSIRATQDLQIISGLPPLVREDDQFRASITLRNTTQQAMKVDVKVDVKPRVTLMDLNLNLKPQTVDIPAGESREVAWMVTAPVQSASNRTEELVWEIEAKDSANGTNGARDALKISQRIIPAVPLTVRQAILVQVDTPLSWDISPPADALPNRGGVKMSLQPTLAAGLPGVKDWFINYPFACLEQKTSKSVGLRDGKIWQTVAAQIPSYLDGDGLANYFPPRNGDANRGSDTLTAYLLAATHEASGVNPAFALREEVRAPMERGLMNFIEGRIQRDFWSPRKDLDMRKIAALEALSRYGKAQGRMVGSIAITPNQWPTHTVIDWYNILRRVQDVPDRAKRLAEATQILRSRISYQGTKMVFSTENEDYWWWLMQNGDVNTARLILAVMDDPAWKDDMGRLANGFISRQKNGAWHTTTANLWGGLALEKFSAKYEAVTVGGSTKASMSTGSTAVDWGKPERTMFLGWGKPQTKDNLTITHQGSGKPWLTLQSVAAVPLKAPFNAGYQIKKTITPIEQANKNQPAGSYSRGDILRITLEVNATTDMTWVVVTDPIPTGATILGNGLGRDSEMATQGEKSGSSGSNGWVAFEERSFEAFRSYYEYLPKGVMKMEYTVRLNNAGEFSLPPSRVEAMYAPEIFGEVPNARVKVEAVK